MTAYDVLEKCMREEIIIFDAFMKEHKILEKAVEEKDWNLLYKAIAMLDALSIRAHQAECMRVEAFSLCLEESKLPSDTTFYSFATTLSVLDRTRAEDYFRTLKFTVLKVKTHSAAFESYLGRSRQFLTRVVKELFPDSGGAGYTKKGARSQATLKTVVLNA